MKFEDVLNSLRKGKMVRRIAWDKKECIKVHSLMKHVIFIENQISYDFHSYVLNLEDLSSTDWEVF